MNTKIKLTTLRRKRSLIMRVILFLFPFFLLTSCCDIGRYLMNNQKRTWDFSGSYEGQCGIFCGAESTTRQNRYTYDEEPDKKRFTYEISFTQNERSAVKLNEFKLTNLDGSPMIVKYYVETYTKAATNTLPFGISYEEHAEAYKRDPSSTKIDVLIWELDSLPAILRESGERKAHLIRIKAETNKPYYKIKGIKVHYDFEVGETRYISENIKYKQRWYLDCRPKLW